MLNDMVNSSLKQAIRLEASTAERNGKLTSIQLDIIYENRWFHLLIPKEYGGGEMALPDFALFMEELATVDGSFAWNVNLGAGANMFAGYMDKEIALQIFSDPKACIAGSGAVSGTATKIGEQYEINGFWKYASGSAHANFFSLNAKLIDASKGSLDAYSSFIVPVSDVEVLDTWKTTGLRATASHDFRVAKSVVPQTYSFDLQKPSTNSTGLLYRFPFQILAEINMLVMSTGLTRRFLELVKEIAGQRDIKEKGIKLSTLPRFKKVLEVHDNEFIRTRERVFVSLNTLWEKAGLGDSILPEEQSSFTQEVLQCAESSRELVDALYPFMGMHTVFESSEINRVWRDFKTASQHNLILPIHLP